VSDPFKGTPFWRPPPEERAALRGHLLAELPPGHVLFDHRETLVVVARDLAADRVIVTGRNPVAAIVTMGWTGRPSMAPFLPETETFPDIDALVEAIQPERAR
jgi:hypothetical protein